MKVASTWSLVYGQMTVYVGDSDIDVKTALAAGTRAIGAAQGNFTKDQLLELGAWRAVGSLDELPGIVEEDGRE